MRYSGSHRDDHAPDRSLYTQLLPDEIRSRLGVYYTPPELAERLLDLSSAEGADWASWTVLDPACGGGAFLVPVAHRILAHHRIAQLPAEEQLRELEARLAGIEIDPFAAWMTRTLLRLLTYPLSREARRPVDVEIEVTDALERVVEDRRSSLAWTTFAWFASEPDHVIHLHGGGTETTRSLSDFLRSA